MADLKISQLVTATSVSVTDYFPIVQTGETKKITPRVFFENVPNRTICLELPETVSSGAMSISTLTTVISSSLSANQIASLAVGTHGMTKEIVCFAIVNSYNVVVNISQGRGLTSVEFNAIGQTVSLKNISGYWYIMSAKGVTIV